MRVMVIDIGGSHVKLATNRTPEHRAAESGPDFTPSAPVARTPVRGGSALQRGATRIGAFLSIQFHGPSFLSLQNFFFDIYYLFL